MLDKSNILRGSALSFFDLRDLAILFQVSLQSARVLANRLVHAGVIVRLRRNLYIRSDARPPDFEIAARLLSPSYISFESALFHTGMILQIPAIVTSAARRSLRVETAGQYFVYRFLPPALFSFGFEREGKAFVAIPEKSLLDALYYASLGRRTVPVGEIDAGKVNRALLRKFLKRYPPKVAALAEEFL